LTFANLFAIILRADMSEPEVVEGVVEEALPNTLFRVKLAGDEIILAYLAGKMRLHRIKVLVGDRVQVQLEPYGGRARIIRRG
jgi:translation initiation factor IF-1